MRSSFLEQNKLCCHFFLHKWNNINNKNPRGPWIHKNQFTVLFRDSIGSIVLWKYHILSFICIIEIKQWHLHDAVENRAISIEHNTCEQKTRIHWTVFWLACNSLRIVFKLSTQALITISRYLQLHQRGGDWSEFWLWVRLYSEADQKGVQTCDWIGDVIRFKGVQKRFHTL